MKETSQFTAIRYPLFIAILITSLFVIHACSTSKETVEPEPAAKAEENQTTTIEQKSILTNIDSISADTAKAKAEKQSISLKKDTVIVDSLMARLSLAEKIGQLFFIPANGYFKSGDEMGYQQLVSKIQKYHVGGLIFFSGNIYAQAVLTNKLQRISKIPLWLTQDMEYGAAMRLNRATRFVPAMGVAATQNPDYAYWVGKITAHEAKALGVNQIFAPVLDVNNNPENPVINVRSFSGNPDTVALYGNRFIEGVKSENVVATGKHFPGHGDTDIDSHLSLPVLKFDYTRLDSVELVPFRSAIENGVKSIMSAHIAFPKLSNHSGLPATMDSTILERILRDSLNFEGLVVTDGLEMNGIASNFSPGDAVIKALKAGVDVMLLSPDMLTAIQEIKVAVQQGRISEQRINQSVRKLLNWKKKYGLFENSQVDISALSSKINIRSNELIAEEISRESLTLVKNKGGILPIRAFEYPEIMVVEVTDGVSDGSSLAGRMRRYHPYVMSHVLDDRSSKAEKEEMLEDARDADLIVIGSFIYVRSGQEVQLSDEHRQFIKKLIKDKPSVLIAFGNPYVVQDLPKTDAQLMAWAANTGQIQSVVPALFGGSEIGGRLPIEIPGMYDIGDGITLPQTALRYDEPEVVGISRDSLHQKISGIMHEAIFDSTFPGGVVAVIKDGVIAYQKGFGYHTYKKLEPVRENTIYDLASLTKAAATTPSIMKLIDEGKISLDDKVGKYIPEFREGKKSEITIRNLLLHNSGLPAFRVYVDKLQERDEIIEAIKNEPLIYEPGTTYEYSDLGFILLGEIVEEVSGKPLDEFARREFYYPLGMESTWFNPKDVGGWITNRIPPTEKDTVFRMKTIQAEAHDERAWYLDGVAGHAGLFSSAGDLAVYSQMLLNNGAYAGRQYLDPATVAIFTKRQSKQVHRGYGFDMKSPGFSTAGTLTSKETFGHLGFTGTSFWIDPKKDLAIILLTNRTYPYRSNGPSISPVRAAIADAVVSSIVKETN